MSENLFEAQYDITKKSKIKKFFDSNKIFIYSSVIILIIVIVSLNFYLANKQSKKITLSENYIQAKLYLESESKTEALKILKEIFFANDSTYSTLSFFLMLNQNLINDRDEISSLFNHLLENNKFDKDLKNLLIYKKALFNANFVEESELLENIKPLLNSESLWKPHALLLLGDFFTLQGQKLKATEFYKQILLINNLQKDFYDQARSRLVNNIDE